MREVRCNSCGKLLAKAIAVALEIKCPRCKTIFNNQKAQSFPAPPNRGGTGEKPRDQENIKEDRTGGPGNL